MASLMHSRWPRAFLAAGLQAQRFSLPGLSGPANDNTEMGTALRANQIMKRTLFCFIAALLAGGLLAQDIALPAPQKSGGMPLMEALAKRSTARAFDSRDLSAQQRFVAISGGMACGMEHSRVRGSGH